MGKIVIFQDRFDSDLAKDIFKSWFKSKRLWFSICIFQWTISEIIITCMGVLFLNGLVNAQKPVNFLESSNKTSAFKKYERVTVLSSKTKNWEYRALQHKLPLHNAIDDMHKKNQLFRFYQNQSAISYNEFDNYTTVDRDTLNDDYITAHRKLIDELLDSYYYENTVHPKRNFREPTRINLSMSLYQILEVDERQQSIVVNVWMVQDWYDEFLDWNPLEYDMINKIIVPYQELWIPDTCLYNSEALEQKRTEALMNAIVETGYWRNDSRGAAVQLMFPAIYTLSCKINVRFFPYDQQNCSFIISSWTHDKSTIDYYPKVDDVNMKNFAQNVEWEVISFKFNRMEQAYKCCPEPWVMLYANLVIRRKPLYYIINLVIPTSIITIVAVTGFFTPSSTSSERDEKLYLGINTLLTMSIMMLMVCNQMPSTSSYVPLMGWYYMGIIFVIVIGTLLATAVLFIHSKKAYAKPLTPFLRQICTNHYIWMIVLRPPANLIEIWTEFGVISKTRANTDKLDPLLLETLNAYQFPIIDTVEFLSSMSSEVSSSSQIASLAKSYVQQIRVQEHKEQRRRKTLADASDFLRGKAVYNNSRLIKKQKMMRRCSLEWEYFANIIDRFLLFAFSLITLMFFTMLVYFDQIFDFV